MVPTGKLVIIGGAVDMGSTLYYEKDVTQPNYIKFFEKGILRRILMESAKKEDSYVLIITTASQIPEIVGPEYVKAFGQLQARNVEVMNITRRNEANDDDFIRKLQKADVVMITGGDQLRLSSILGGTRFLELLRKKYHKEDFLIAGTSAGAAAASNTMIYRGSDREALVQGELQMTGGLGFIDNVIIDTHFVQRGRIGRLLYAVASNPGMLGIGLGEDAGFLITAGCSMEAIGSGLTILIDGRSISQTNIYDVEAGSPVSIKDMKVHVLSIADTFNICTHEMTIKNVVKLDQLNLV